MHNGVVQRPLCFYHCWQVGFSGLARAARLLRYLGVWFAGDDGGSMEPGINWQFGEVFQDARRQNSQLNNAWTEFQLEFFFF